LALFLVSCTNSEPEYKSQAIRQDQQVGRLAEEIAQKKTDQKSQANKNYIERLEEKLHEKLHQKNLISQNVRHISDALKGHTKTYKFSGHYKVMVIPVQFSDTTMNDVQYFQSGKAKETLFGANERSLTEYYKHASAGKFIVQGEVTPIVAVDHPLAFYGEAVSNQSDRNARGLVVDALKKLKTMKTDESWWEQFDNWDLNDYDGDGNYHEPDGFMDAVVLIYAGKSQASCQRSFDPKGERPASADVPEGPRRQSAVECFNRLWPHRWSISLDSSDPEYLKEGPLVEGLRRPSMNGLRISDKLFALDYNMQSEYSDVSTFIHEFGHSISLPDIYANKGENSTGSWEIMSSNAPRQAQEMSTFSKISLGWLMPKIIQQGEKASLYLGHYNFVSNERRNNPSSYEGPDYHQEMVEGEIHNYDILSTIPEYSEAVYRSAVVLTKPGEEKIKVIDSNEASGQVSAYSGRFDGAAKSLTFSFDRKEGVNQLSFDTIYHIETETNFDSKDPDIKVTTDFDIAHVFINGEKVEDLRTISGDTNFDTLNESSEYCNAQRVLELRTKSIAEELSEVEKVEFVALLTSCQEPSWQKKVYDLSQVTTDKITVEIQYVTDAGYTEFGVVVDNVTYGDQVLDFESHQNLGQFKALINGEETVTHQQFYLMEYRDPQTIYLNSQKEKLSYNMDNNIEAGTQAFFLNGLGTLRDNFRVATFKYQPGLLVWYFNGKYDRTSNNPIAQNGQGYLLVLNSKVKELPLPGTLGDKRFFDEKGFYDQSKESYKQALEDQRKKFICFSHTAYSTYLTGEAPDCSAYRTENIDIMQSFTINWEGQEQELIYRREGFNEILPKDRYLDFGVGVPFRHAAQIRTGLATFRPSTWSKEKPFRVYKEVNSQMVLDDQLTHESVEFENIDSFSDSMNGPEVNPEYGQDSVVVEKTGFKFKVVEPNSRITNLYSSDSATDNDSVYRRPTIKVYFDWE
ncbi:MAG: immune inhibitor A, partial [Bdellovibrionales bacterium]|nr:immune inhibitor A [Bdellovibrionales bacterium]